RGGELAAFEGDRVAVLVDRADLLICTAVRQGGGIVFFAQGALGGAVDGAVRGAVFGFAFFGGGAFGGESRVGGLFVAVGVFRLELIVVGGIGEQPDEGGFPGFEVTAERKAAFPLADPVAAVFGAEQEFVMAGGNAVVVVEFEFDRHQFGTDGLGGEV